MTDKKPAFAGSSGVAKQDKYSAVWVSHSSINDFLKCHRAYFLLMSGELTFNVGFTYLNLYAKL